MKTTSQLIYKHLNLLLLVIVSLGLSITSAQSQSNKLLAQYNDFKTKTDAFFKGFQMQNYSPNASLCLNTTEVSVRNYTLLNGRLSNANDSIMATLLVAQHISTSSNSTRLCVYAINDFVSYQVSNYAKFTGWPDFTRSLISNLIRNTFNLQNLYEKMTLAMEEKRKSDYYETLGKVCRVMMTFESIDADSYRRNLRNEGV